MSITTSIVGQRRRAPARLAAALTRLAHGTGADARAKLLSRRTK